MNIIDSVSKKLLLKNDALQKARVVDAIAELAAGATTCASFAMQENCRNASIVQP